MTDQNAEAPRPMTEEELQNLSEEELQQLYMEQYNAEMKQIRVEDMVMQTIVTLINLGGRRAGLAPETEDERDPAQLQLAINAAMAELRANGTMETLAAKYFTDAFTITYEDLE